jgi:hypothetical protein
MNHMRAGGSIMLVTSLLAIAVACGSKTDSAQTASKPGETAVAVLVDEPSRDGLPVVQCLCDRDVPRSLGDVYAGSSDVVHATTDGRVSEIKIADSTFPVYSFEVVDRFKGDGADLLDVIVGFDPIDYSSGEAVFQPGWHYILYLTPLRFKDGESQPEYVLSSGSLGVYVRPPGLDEPTFFAVDSEFPLGKSITLKEIRSEIEPTPDMVALSSEDTTRVVAELSALCAENRVARDLLRERLMAAYGGKVSTDEFAELAVTFADQIQPYGTVVASIAASNSTMLLSLNSALEQLKQAQLLLSTLASDAVDDAGQLAQLASHVANAGAVLQSWGVTGCEDMAP